MKGQGPDLRKLVQIWDQLCIKEGVLWRCFEQPQTAERRPQLVAPTVVRQDILDDLHSGIFGGHLGEKKTRKRLKERFYWPGHWTDVQNWCRTCPSCATRKIAAPKKKAPLTPVKVGYPMQMVAVDIMGPLP